MSTNRIKKLIDEIKEENAKKTPQEKPRILLRLGIQAVIETESGNIGMGGGESRMMLPLELESIIPLIEETGEKAGLMCSAAAFSVSRFIMKGGLEAMKAGKLEHVQNDVVPLDEKKLEECNSTVKPWPFVEHDETAETMLKITKEGASNE